MDGGDEDGLKPVYLRSVSTMIATILGSAIPWIGCRANHIAGHCSMSRCFCHKKSTNREECREQHLAWLDREILNASTFKSISFFAKGDLGSSLYSIFPGFCPTICHATGEIYIVYYA